MNEPTCHDESFGPYSENGDVTNTAYHCDREDYQTLVGPAGFECRLGEPEDRIWIRDGQQAVDRLNQLHELCEAMWEHIANASNMSPTAWGRMGVELLGTGAIVGVGRCLADGTPCCDRVDHVCEHCGAVGREPCRRQTGYPCLRK